MPTSKDDSAYGSSGESLFALAHISRLEIISMCNTDTEAYQTTFDNGHFVSFRESEYRKGTTVRAYNLFSNLPVRRLSIKVGKERQNIRRLMEIITLANPGICFRLFDINQAVKVIQTSTVHIYSNSLLTDRLAALCLFFRISLALRRYKN